ncbi:MAG: hypothetical protein RDU20_19940 [Desulfomonilaceae bacterium]|nr:hypothetical protein [Desulfomonilaceae bacterium]
MFPWSRPYCPCDPATKDWIEKSLAYLCREFSSNIFTDRLLVLPTEEFFSLPYEYSRESAEALFSRICAYMEVSESRVTLKFHHEPNKILFVNDRGDYVPGPYFGGLYEQSRRGHVITLDSDELQHPAHLIATMAHELAHARLRGEGKVRWDRYDEELLTDLTASVLGFAIFMANSPRVWVSQFSKWPGTEFNRPEYMTAPMYGYTLAHLAWHQGQRKPQWAKYLGSHVIHDFKDAARFLFKTGESTFITDVKI